jgi:hypothetical protein
MTNAVNGYRCTGIFPFTKDIFPDFEFVAEKIDESTEQFCHSRGEVINETEEISALKVIEIPDLETETHEAKSSCLSPYEVSPVPNILPVESGYINRRKRSSAILTDQTPSIMNQTQPGNEEPVSKARICRLIKLMYTLFP